jgi:DNA topoisomerase IB
VGGQSACIQSVQSPNRRITCATFFKSSTNRAICSWRVASSGARAIEDGCTVAITCGVGNEEYERENDSFGLTTLKARQVDVNGAELHFEFRGKGGKWHRIAVHDRRLAQVVRRCQDLPGQELFQYTDHDGRRQNVHSTDVNEYLKEISGQDFNAYLDGSLARTLRQRATAHLTTSLRELSPEEAAVLALLQHRVTAAVPA